VSIASYVSDHPLPPSQSLSLRMARVHHTLQTNHYAKGTKPMWDFITDLIGALSLFAMLFGGLWMLPLLEGVF
jgi:hypothetical protein